MTTTYDRTKGSAGDGGYDWYGKESVFLISSPNVTITSADVSTDVIQCLPVKKGMRVLSTIVEVVTQGAATGLTATVGDGAGAASFDTGIDFTAAAGTQYMSLIGTDAYAAGGAGKLYTADDTIDLVLTVNTITVSAVVKVHALCVRV